MHKGLHKLVLICLIGGFFTGCSKKPLPGNTSGIYQEDLSKSRPGFELNDEEILIKGEISGNTGKATAGKDETEGHSNSVNKQLTAIFQTINQQNKAVKFMPGFRIQLYVGNIRAEADAAKAFVYRNFPELYPYVSFSQPTYRVKVGDFMSKTEAEQILASIRLQFTTAVIIPDKIEIEKGLRQAIAEN